jgi:hypothetical protein
VWLNFWTSLHSFSLLCCLGVDGFLLTPINGGKLLSSDPLYHCFFIGDEKGELLKLL